MPSPKEVIKLLAPLIARFPQLPMENITYNRNFVFAINKSLSIQAAIPELIKPFDLKDNLQLKMSYVSNESFSYNAEKLRKFEKSVSNDIANLAEALPSTADLHTDIKQLKNHSSDFLKQLKQLIRVSPIIYDASGAALKTQLPESFILPRDEIHQLQALYTDLFKEHLAPLLSSIANIKGLGDVHKITRHTLNQHIPKVVIPATTLYSESNQLAVEKTLYLEEVPAAYTPLRGSIASDCSMVSVPYYGLLKNTRTFWIIRSKNENEKPAGYVFLAECVYNGNIHPYIITINGARVTSLDCQAIFELLKTHYETDAILVADWLTNTLLVNFAAVKNSIEPFNLKPVNIELPKGWQSIPKGEAFADYYSLSSLSSGLYVHQDNFDIKVTKIYPNQSKNLYPVVDNMSNIDQVCRLIIGYYFKQSTSDTSNIEQAEKLLRVDPEQINHIRPLINLHTTGNLTTEEFLILHHEFDFSLENLNEIHVLNRAPLINPLYEKAHHKFEKKHWVDICVSTFNQLYDFYQGTPRDDHLKDLIASIPDEYIPDYWDRIRPFFFLPGQTYPDHYMIRRIIKHFHSYGTMEQMLVFLNEHPESYSGIQGHDGRWFAFFMRAKALMPEMPELKNAIKTIYYQRALAKNTNLSYHELAMLCSHGLALSATDETVWLKAVFKAQGYNGSDKQRFYEHFSET